MPDNIRQEAVERLKRSMPMMGRSICADIEYLIDQLAEAIAQRDEYLRIIQTEHNVVHDRIEGHLYDDPDDLISDEETSDTLDGDVGLLVAKYRALRGQLASIDDAGAYEAREMVIGDLRELCDRAADYIRHQPARDVVWRDGWLRDYDAHRATEPSPEPNVFGTQEVVDAITDDRAAERSEAEGPGGSMT